MAKYVINNISGKILELIVPAPSGSGRNSMVFNLQPTAYIDILPWAGSLTACKNIAMITRYLAKNYIYIVEE